MGRSPFFVVQALSFYEDRKDRSSSSILVPDYWVLRLVHRSDTLLRTGIGSSKGGEPGTKTKAGLASPHLTANLSVLVLGYIEFFAGK